LLKMGAGATTMILMFLVVFAKVDERAYLFQHPCSIAILNLPEPLDLAMYHLLCN
jgi:hypothetical protein